MTVDLLQGAAIQFHAVTVLSETVAYLSANNGVVVKTGTSFYEFDSEVVLLIFMFKFTSYFLSVYFPCYVIFPPIPFHVLFLFGFCL